jgi:hypothetical protein
MTRRALLVLGMHRSGTSALGGVLARVGVEPPRTLMAANEHNPLGFWESERLREFHDRLLQENGTEWDVWTRVSRSTEFPNEEERWGEEFRAVLQGEFGSAPLFFVKDPRICRMVPFWLRHSDANGIEASAIFVLRSPLEIARSLGQRDGLGMEHSLLLWLRHALDAEFATRSISRTFVRYADLLADWKREMTRIAADLRLPLSQWSARVEEEVAAFLKPQLRHHVLGVDALAAESPLASWVGLVHSALEALISSSPSSTESAQQTLDAIRAAFDETADVFGHVLTADRRVQRRKHEQSAEALTLQTSNLSRERTDWREHASNLELERNEWRQHAANLEFAHRELHRHASALERRRDELQGHADGLECEREELRRHASNLGAERERLRSESAALTSRVSELTANLEAATARLQALESSRSWRWTAALRAAARLFPLTVSSGQVSTKR